MRGNTGNSVTVGGCGDPDLVTTATGATPKAPCPKLPAWMGPIWYCNEHDVQAWVLSAKSLKDSLSAAWSALLSAEADHGVTTEQARLGYQMEKLEEDYKAFPEEGSSWTNPITQHKTVVSIISWMTTAACLLEQTQRAIRKYKLKPPPTPTPGPTSGTTPSYVPSPGGATPGATPFTQRVGQTTLLLLAVGVLGGGAYLYARHRAAGGRGFKLPLPPRK